MNKKVGHGSEHVTRDDDAERFAVFYREHYSLILTTCIRRLSDHAAAEDAVAEVFRVAWQRFPEKEDPSLAWLYAVARNVVGNEYRRRSRARALQDRIEQAAKDAHAGDKEEVRDAMGTLRQSDRELLYMAYWEGLRGEEIAGILRISVPAVWRRLTRARQAMRRVLDRMSARSPDHG